ncbi:alpha/beta fold hydrolase [Pseudonocardia pini]|uniref:alpha/beta fold hydrolase n=1 Tax=Pseudonocardia pini TaxID=2758030 RepID=UPI0015F11470|nr:alpha/beta hydrolase [Pseudonocardia pini]
MTTVVLLPGVVNPGRLKFAPLLAELGSVRCEIKELELYAGARVPADYSLALEVEGLHRFVSERGLGRVHLFGYSIGGAIALAYAAEHGDRVASMALDEPATDFTDDDRRELAGTWPAGLADLPAEEQMARFAETLVPPGVDFGPLPPLPPGPEMALRPAGVAAMLRTVGRESVDEARLCAYAGPVYLCYGSLSGRRFASMAARMPGRFGRCTVERYEGRHHLDSPHQTEPARVARALRALWGQAEPTTDENGL